jgi:hypothetical protein
MWHLLDLLQRINQNSEVMEFGEPKGGRVGWGGEGRGGGGGRGNKGGGLGERERCPWKDRAAFPDGRAGGSSLAKEPRPYASRTASARYLERSNTGPTTKIYFRVRAWGKQGGTHACVCVSA